MSGAINARRARSALQSLSSDIPRDDWITLGMAFKSAGGSFDDFHQWSMAASNYENEKSCRSAWSSFKPDGGITAATLFYLARQHGWKDPDRLSRYTRRPPKKSRLRKRRV